MAHAVFTPFRASFHIAHFFLHYIGRNTKNRFHEIPKMRQSVELFKIRNSLLTYCAIGGTIRGVKSNTTCERTFTNSNFGYLKKYLTYCTICARIKEIEPMNTLPQARFQTASKPIKTFFLTYCVICARIKVS